MATAKPAGILRITLMLNSPSPEFARSIVGPARRHIRRQAEKWAEYVLGR